MSTPADDPQLTTEALAERWNRSPKALRVDRSRGRGPTFIKLGPGKKAPVRYRLSDVLAYERTCGIAANNNEEGEACSP